MRLIISYLFLPVLFIDLIHRVYSKSESEVPKNVRFRVILISATGCFILLP